MIRSKASSTVDANPAAISARAIVGRPRESSSSVASSATWASTGIPISRRPIDRPVEPRPPGCALSSQGCLERLVVRVHPEPEDVELALPQAEIPGHEGVDLDAGDQRHALRHGVGDQVVVSGERVVVGEREDPDTGRRDVLDEPGRGQDTIRAARVGVQVDRRRSRRDDTKRRGCRVVASRALVAGACGHRPSLPAGRARPR
jgi:hypothetical protein